MVEHTPTPWQQHNDYTPEGRVTIIANVDGVYEPDGSVHNTYDTICVCEDQFGERLQNAEANARHIVHCVNVHDDLVKALEEAREALHFHYVEWDGEPEDAVPLQLARAKCDAALARVKGGEGS